MDKRRFVIAILISVIIVTTSFSIFFAYQKFKPTPAYEFKTSMNHPQEIRDLMKEHETIVLFFIKQQQGEYSPCEQMKPKMADLQSQYSGTDVTFMTIDVNDNTIASQSITKNYGIQQVPTVVVVRSDGAVVTFIGESDTNTVKSAIEEAQHGKSIFPF